MTCHFRIFRDSSEEIRRDRNTGFHGHRQDHAAGADAVGCYSPPAR